MELIDNKEKSRFEVVVDGHLGIIEYQVQNDNLVITHTEVAKELAGQGVASKMTKLVFEDIQSRSLKIIPTCPYTQKYIQKHPEWESIVAH